MEIAIAILAIGALIIVHEAGHFGLARAFGMRVEAFSIGFGPSLVSWKGSQTEYRLGMVPLGGYVRIGGMSPGDEVDDDPSSFSNRPLWQRFLVLFAGPFANWLLAFLLLVTLMVVGLERASPEPVIGRIGDKSPAAAAGLRPGDRVLQADGAPIATWKELVRAIGEHRARPLELKVLRGNSELTLRPTVGKDGMLGVRPSVVVERRGLGEAVPAAFLHSGRLVADNLKALGAWVRGSKDVQMSGPPGIVMETADAVKAGGTSLWAILVLISLALALMNLLPLPALDGGRLLFLVIAMVRKRPVSANVEAAVHAVGFALILSLIVWASWGDIARRLARNTEPPAAPAPAPAAAPDAGAPAAP